jgi:FixJ family two-component response regulator
MVPTMVNVRRSIAVIDDDVRVLESLESLFESSGHRVQLFLSAQEFLDSSAVRTVDYIVSDIGMPNMNGLELLERVRSSVRKTPVILITGRSSQHSENFYFEKGAVGFFRKPCDGNRLLSLIDTLSQDLNR